MIVAIQLKSFTISLLIDSLFVYPKEFDARPKKLTPNKITIIMVIATVINSSAICLFVLLSKSELKIVDFFEIIRI